MSISGYESYKNSGLPWLGEIPSHWSISQSRRLFALRKERAAKNERQLTASQKHGVIYQDEYMTLEGQQVVRVLTGADILKHVEPNDFVISMRSFQGGIEWCGYKGSISSAYVMLIPSASIHVKFFSYLFKCKPYIQALQSTSNLVRDGQALRYENFTLIDLPVIPYSEQQAIAEFLSHETTKIDALISEQNRLIGLLKQKRQAIIGRAVTKGLNASVTMRYSGTEWLGELPEHWSTPPLSARYSIELGKMLDESRITGQHLVPYLRNVDVQWGAINFEDLPEMDITEAEYSRYTVEKGDLLVCEGGEVGRAAIVGDIQGVIGFQKALHRLRARGSCEQPKFMYYTFFWAAFTGAFNVAGSSTIAHLTGEQLRKFRFPTPPLSEQSAIIRFLDGEIARIDALMGEARSAVTLLQERRTALISAAVTGKIDVRGFVRVQPERGSPEEVTAE
jgi:type I restriction enzyme, S subunit